MFPGLWKHLLRPVFAALGEIRDGIIGGIPDDVKRLVYSPPREDSFFREWGLGGAMLTITGILFVYLVLGFV